MLPVVLYGCETWSIILREEQRLSEDAQEQGAEKIFESKRQELKGDWKKFHSKDLNDLHLLPTNSVMQIYY